MIIVIFSQFWIISPSITTVPTLVFMSPSMVLVVLCRVGVEVHDILGQHEVSGEVINMDEAVGRSKLGIVLLGQTSQHYGHCMLGQGQDG